MAEQKKKTKMDILRTGDHRENTYREKIGF